MSWFKYVIVGFVLVTCCKCSPIGFDSDDDHGDREKRTLILGVLFKKLLFQQALNRNLINVTTVAPQRNMQESSSSADMPPLGTQQNPPGIVSSPQAQSGDQTQQGGQESQGSLPAEQQIPQGQPPQGAPPQGLQPQEVPSQGSGPEGQPPSDLSLGPTSQEQPPQGIPPPQVSSQGPPPQGEPSQGTPPQGTPPQGLSPQELPPQALPPQGLPPQGLPPQGLPPQGQPPQGLPPQGLPPQVFPFQRNPSLQIPPNYSFGLQSLNVFGPQQPLVFPPNFPFGVQRFRQLPFGPAPPLGAQAGPQSGPTNFQFDFRTFSPTDSTAQGLRGQFASQAQPTAPVGDASLQQGLGIPQGGQSPPLGSDGNIAQDSDSSGSPAPLPDQDSSAQSQASSPPPPQPQTDLNGGEQQQAQPDFSFGLGLQQSSQSGGVSQGPPPSGDTNAQPPTVLNRNEGPQFQFGTRTDLLENGLQQLPPNFFFDRSTPDAATATDNQQNGQRGLPGNSGLPPNFNFAPLDNNIQQQFNSQSPQSQQQSGTGDASQQLPLNGFSADLNNLPPNFQLPNGQPQSDQTANGLFEPRQFAAAGTDNNVLDFSQQSGSSPNDPDGQQQRQQQQQTSFPNNFQQFSSQSNFDFGNQQFDASAQFQGNPFQQGFF